MSTLDTSFPARLKPDGNPEANPESQVVSGQARFTVLTSRLVRLEWSENGQFEDRGTFAFPNRYAPRPVFTTTIEGETLLIETEFLKLRYSLNSGAFSPENLSISFVLNGEERRWIPGMPNRGNLGGTRRTLDGVANEVSLEHGLLSRDGWSLVNDSASVLFNRQDGWVEARPAHALQDWYFFGYGHDYKSALREYTLFGGSIALIPRFVLGAWWSRYWAYSEQDLRQLVADFREHGLPLDVLVLDMDWHTPDSWTGYTWNRELFPDPPAFLKWVHEQGLRVTLNLHPAEGVQSFEEIYPTFARTMGADPASKEPVPFQVTNRRFMQHYFELLHHPMEEEGVDFWWMDWQQGESSEMVGLDPLPWINHLHFQDSARRGHRPMLYSRWGGLGNHRYYIGFSGDTYSTWGALQFLPYFTSTSSNVLYGWWSHDIGGHFGAVAPELFARWVQYGTLSPCLRLHATKDPLAERRPWTFPREAFEAIREAFLLRYRLVPYLYTLGQEATETGLSVCRPMYYEYPEVEDAYLAGNQYYLGEQIIAAPIVEPANPDNGLATVDVWVPEGTWIDYETLETFTGPRWVKLVGDLKRVPMLVKAGTILPLAEPGDNTDHLPKDRLVLQVFAGEKGAFRLYEDDGISSLYKEGQYERTLFRMTCPDETRLQLEINPVEGGCEVLPAQRSYEVRLVGTNEPHRVLIDGVETLNWRYDKDSITTVIQIPARDKQMGIRVEAQAVGPISALGEAHNRAVILGDVARLTGKQFDWSQLPGALLAVAEASSIEAIARLGGPFPRFREFSIPEEAVKHLGAMVLSAGEGEPVEADVTWKLYQGDRVETRYQKVQGREVIYSPFKFEGKVNTMRWEAEVSTRWRDTAIVHRYQSQALFPSVPFWQTVLYNRANEQINLEQVVDAQGNLNPDLSWETWHQEASLIQNVNQPFMIRLHDRHKDRLKAGEDLAAYAVSIVHCPDEREVMLAYWGNGPMQFYLNGEALSETETGDHTPVTVALYGPQQTAPFRLKRGQNRLVLATSNALPNNWWSYRATFLRPDGSPMTDLSYS